MKNSTRRWLSVFLLALTVAQILPAALFGALADGVVTIMGIFSPNAIYHSVIFFNDSDKYATQLVADGAQCIVPESPTKQGVGDDAYEFIGWSSNPGGIDPETDPINSNVTFTAVYETLEWVTITVEYVFDGTIPGGINLPPPRTYQVQKGKLAVIDDPTPIIKGIQTETLRLNYSKVADVDETITVTYKEADDVSYTVNYWYEKPGIAGEAAVGNKNQFVKGTTLTGTVPYGELFVPITQDQQGFNREAQGYSEITEDTVYDEYYTRQEYILTLDSNGEGATYFAPEAIKYGMPLALPDMVECPGYTFDNWEPLVTQMPANDLTLKAKWTPNPVDVKVVYWLEKPGIIGDPDINDLSQFDFVHSDVIQFLAGSTATITAANAPDITELNDGKQPIPVATLFDYKTETVKGDGTTVINVYYKRVVFGLQFLVLFGSEFPDGSTESTLLLKFQQPLGGIWPAQGEPNAPLDTTEEVFVGWLPVITDFATSIWLTNRVTFTTEMLPGKDDSVSIGGADYPGYVVIARSESKKNIAEYEISYYLQNIEDDDYTLSTSFSQTLNLLSGSAILAKTIEGFNVVGTNRYEPGTQVCDFYYDRKIFPLRFDTMLPTNAVGLSQSDKAIPEKPGVRYGDTYAKYLPTSSVWGLQTTGFRDNNGLHFDFTGWYKEAACVTPVLMTDTMPDIPGDDSFLQLYAGWAPSNATVTFKVEGEQPFTRTTQGGTSLDSTPGAFPADPDLITEGLEFMGWFEEADGKAGVPGTSPFGPGTKVYKDMTVVAKFRKIYTNYTIHYDYDDGQGTYRTDYWTPKEVLHVQVGTTLQIPGDVDIPTFQGYGILWHPTSIRLGPDKAQNSITLVYNDATIFKYKVNNYLENSTTTVPGFAVGLEKSTAAYRLVLWAEKDPAQRYYPVKESEIVQLSPNGIVEVTFYYKPYTYVEYQEKAILHGSNYNGNVFSSDAHLVRVGDTAETQDKSTSKVMDIYTYQYVPGPNESHLVISKNDQFELIRNYYQQYTLKFEVGDSTKGQLIGAASITALHNTRWDDLTTSPPTPVPIGDHYFAGWEPEFPETVMEEQTYTAIFKKNTRLLLKTNGATHTYDGIAHTVSGFKVFEDGTDVTSLYTISGITALGASGTNVGTYPNKFQYSNPQNPAITVLHKSTNTYITEGLFIDTEESDLVITPLTLKGKVTPIPPPGSFIYGDPIPEPTLEWQLEDWSSESTRLKVTVDTYDKVANSKAPLKDAGDYFYRPVLNPLENLNYNIFQITPIDSSKLTIGKAPLKVKPKRVSHEQDTPLPTSFDVDMSVYKYNENRVTVGPDVTYALQGIATGSESIGTTGKISLVTKSREPDNNYNITYEDGDFIIHGVVAYHANYPSGQDPVVRRGIYEDPNDPVSPVHAGALGFGSQELVFQRWTYDPVETATNVVQASDAIGPRSIDVYAQWVPLYQLTIHHQDITEDFELLPIEEHWLMEGTEYTLEAQEIDKYEPVYVRCLIDDVEAFTVTIDLEEGVPFTMPDKTVEAFIYYRLKPVQPLTEFVIEGDGKGYWLFGEDIPLAGVNSMNRGLCFE